MALTPMLRMISRLRFAAVRLETGTSKFYCLVVEEEALIGMEVELSDTEVLGVGISCLPLDHEFGFEGIAIGSINMPRLIIVQVERSLALVHASLSI